MSTIQNKAHAATGRIITAGKQVIDSGKRALHFNRDATTHDRLERSPSGVPTATERIIDGPLNVNMPMTDGDVEMLREWENMKLAVKSSLNKFASKVPGEHSNVPSRRTTVGSETQLKQGGKLKSKVQEVRNVTVHKFNEIKSMTHLKMEEAKVAVAGTKIDVQEKMAEITHDLKNKLHHENSEGHQTIKERAAHAWNDAKNSARGVMHKMAPKKHETVEYSGASPEAQHSYLNRDEIKPISIGLMGMPTSEDTYLDKPLGDEGYAMPDMSMMTEEVFVSRPATEIIKDQGHIFSQEMREPEVLASELIEPVPLMGEAPLIRDEPLVNRPNLSMEGRHGIDQIFLQAPFTTEFRSMEAPIPAENKTLLHTEELGGELASGKIEGLVNPDFHPKESRMHLDANMMQVPHNTPVMAPELIYSETITQMVTIEEPMGAELMSHKSHKKHRHHRHRDEEEYQI